MKLKLCFQKIIKATYYLFGIGLKKAINWTAKVLPVDIIVLDVLMIVFKVK